MRRPAAPRRAACHSRPRADTAGSAAETTTTVDAMNYDKPDNNSGDEDTQGTGAREFRSRRHIFSDTNKKRFALTLTTEHTNTHTLSNAKYLHFIVSHSHVNRVL
jgi:hypothetical protein